MDQPGKVANPARRGQLNKTFFYCIYLFAYIHACPLHTNSGCGKNRYAVA